MDDGVIGGPRGRIPLTIGLGCALAAATSSGCDGRVDGLRHGPAELDHANVPVVELAGSTINRSVQLAQPFDIALVGTRLVVIDVAADSALHVIDITTGGEPTSFGFRGEGPGEFRSPWSLDVVPGSDRKLWVYDLELRRLTLVDLGPRGCSISTARALTLTGSATPIGPLWVDDNSLVSLGFYPDSRFAVFDSTGLKRDAWGELPGQDEDMAPDLRQHVYQASLVAHPSRNRLAAFTRHMSQIEFYTADGRVLNIGQGPVKVEPRYDVVRRKNFHVMQGGAALRFGYVDAAASRDFVFALFSGRTGEGHKRRAHFARFIHVFDWDGNFKLVLRLDVDALTIAVDEQSQWLYAVRHDPEPAIVRYSLDGVLGAEDGDHATSAGGSKLRDSEN